MGSAEAVAQDLLGQVYEYFLGQFALAEGNKGGQFCVLVQDVSRSIRQINLLMGSIMS